MNITEAQIKAIAQWASNDPTIVSIQLFGSRVRGTAREDSDLDVAIDVGVSESALQDWIIRKADWESDLRALTGLLVHVDLYHPTLASHVYQYVADCGFEAYRA